MRLLAAGSLVLVLLAACSHPAPATTPTAPTPGPPAWLVETQRATEVPAEDVAAEDVAERDDPSTMLDGAWSATFQHDVKYAQAIKNMHNARAAYTTAAAPLFASTGGVPMSTDFQNANALLDQLNRRSAPAYYAPDATSEQRVVVLDEIAALLFRWSQKLDELGLTKTPAAYRTNGTIALTFEDVVQGPSKRWRAEGLTLANLCIQRAKTDNVQTSAARGCAELYRTHSTAKDRAPSKDTPECACPPGDPLCSASMSGWCKPGPK